jgi:hypothetical protein
MCATLSTDGVADFPGWPSLPGGVRRAILATLPTHIGQRNHQLHEFAIRLRRIRQIDHSDAALTCYVAAWHGQGVQRDVIGTLPVQVSVSDFLRGWQTLEPADERRLQRALEKARTLSLPDSIACHCYSRTELTLATLCAALQVEHGTDPFYLAGRLAGELVDVPHRTAWRALRTLETRGVLKLVELGQWSSRDATLWRFLSPNGKEEEG